MPRIFHGTPDNYNPVDTCKAFVARLKDAKRDVELTEYPNAPHGFDNPLGAVQRRSPKTTNRFAIALSEKQTWGT